MNKIEAALYVILGVAIGVAYYLWQSARTVWEPIQGIMT